MDRRLLTLASLLTAASLSTLNAYAQGLDLCPRSGLVIKGTNSTGDYTATTKGADPSDRSVCISVAEGPGTGINNGKAVSRIYGWYDLTNLNMTADTRSRAQAGLGAILTGQITETSFDMTLNTVGRSQPWSGVESWKRTGQTTISVGGKPTNVITLHEAFKGGANSRYDAAWDLWYDPALHLFVKGHLTTDSGFAGRVRDFEIQSVSGP
jgi:hypothetical protein